MELRKDLPDERGGGRRPGRLVLGLALALSLVGVAVSLTWPMGRDQGIFAWVGDVILHGGLPYRDAWDLKGPSTYLQFAGIQAIFGRNMWGVRVFALLVMAAGAWGAYVLGGRAAGRNAGLWSVAFLLLPYLGTGYWNTAQPDGWMAMLGIACTALVWQNHGPPWLRGGAAGLVFGFVILYKPPIYVIFPLLLVSAIIVYRRRFREDEWRTLSLSLVAGGLLSAGAVIGWLGLRGGLDAAWSVLVAFNSGIYVHAHTVTFEWALKFLGQMLQAEYVLAVIGLVVLHSQDRALARLLVTWMAAGFLIVAVQMKMYGYHWNILISVVAIGAGVATASALRRLGESEVGTSALTRPEGRKAFIITAIAILAIIPPAMRIVSWTEALARPVIAGDVEAYYYEGVFGGPGDFSLAADLRVADYLREHTEPSDPVLLWGLEPMVYYLADRRPPTKYGFRYPITAALAYAPQMGRSLLDELLLDLRMNRPVYFILIENDLNNLQQRSSREEFYLIPELAAFLSDNYVHEITIGDFELWRLRRGNSG